MAKLHTEVLYSSLLLVKDYWQACRNHRECHFCPLKFAMSIKTIVLIVFIIIIISLGNALFNLVTNKDPEHSKKTLRALTIRIGLSLALLIGLIVAYANGFLQPTGLGARIEQIRSQAGESN